MEEVKQDLRRLDKIHNESMEKFHKENTKQNSELSLLKDEFEKQKRKLVEQISRLQNELEIRYEETQNGSPPPGMMQLLFTLATYDTIENLPSYKSCS